MTSSKQKLSSEFGVFSKTPLPQIKSIRTVAQALVSAHRANDIMAWEAIILRANQNLTKYQRGMFSAFALMLSEDKNS